MEDDMKMLVSDEIKRFRESYQVGLRYCTHPLPTSLAHSYLSPAYSVNQNQSTASSTSSQYMAKLASGYELVGFDTLAFSAVAILPLLILSEQGTLAPLASFSTNSILRCDYKSLTCGTTA